ncbi:hypothetical protein BD410DRAFT_781917 [Rickenella mellea]|uniref:P-loop containing nucleoside triphosphate hydrolase protein n=1 Tax=Rickenella mellea TaxID=50990 RepID=A0A4Y7QK02_9AGAM|nr:hypothetical protein BD410DRAFT_781917 [Rickenella mellea]
MPGNPRVLKSIDRQQNTPRTPEPVRQKRAPSLVAGNAEGSQKRRAQHDHNEGSSTPEAVKRLRTGVPVYARSHRLPDESPRKQAQRLSQHVSGFSLNYDVESRIESIDRNGLNSEEILTEAITISNTIYGSEVGLTVKDALKDLGLKTLRDVLPGLEVRLLRHQVIGVSWMLHQEKNTPHKGGILADEMGLGKTVQMIATMAMNPPKHGSGGPRTTLIVVPVALLEQWKDEIETKSNGLFRVHIHHGRGKMKSPDQMRRYDVILTTYHSLTYEFATPDGMDSGDESDYLSRHGGPLTRMVFYRLILDEAQLIRNRSTQSSKAVAKLEAEHRWMLTGTPVTNSLADLYGLIRAGRYRPWNSWEDFDEYIGKTQLSDPPLAGMRAKEILKPLLLRRTKNAQLEGEPLLLLPPKDIDIVELEFSPDERLIYDNLERRSRMELNKFIKQNALVKNHAAVLVMILRLRQLCCHPNLILSMAEGYEDPSLIVGSDDAKELSKATKMMGKKWVAEIKQKFMRRARMEDLEFGLDDNGGSDTDMACPTCKDFFMNGSGRVVECGHEICIDCLSDLMQSAVQHDNVFQGSEAEMAKAEKEYEAAVTRGFRPCPNCRQMFDPKKVFFSSAFEPDDEEVDAARRADRKAASTSRESPSKEETPERDIMDLESDDEMPDFSQLLASSAPKDKKGKGKALQDDNVLDISLKDVDDATNPQEIGPVPSEKVIATWKRGNVDLEPSAKMVALIDLLKEWDMDSNCQDKAICFSQWTSMLDLIEILFERHGIQFLRYDGKMNREARDSALATFRKAGGPRVMIISTKCGSVGLNLVSANRVVNLDLAWNFASESQAYDRVHRVGQDKNVYVKRFVVKNTIEERMLRLQDVKIGLADAALGEGTEGSKLHKMSVQELKALFGMAQLGDKAGKSI